jgi:hypothetical protein
MRAKRKTWIPRCRMHLAQELSLKRYLLSQGVPTYDLVREETDFESESRHFVQFLNTTRIVVLPPSAAPKVAELSISRRDLKEKTYHDFIDLIVRDMRNRRIPNVLTYGYGLHAATHPVNSANSFLLLRQDSMAEVYHRVGQDIFTRMILSTSGYVTDSEGNYIRVFGVPLWTLRQSASKQKSAIKAKLVVRKSRMLHRSQISPRAIIPDSPEMLLKAWMTPLDLCTDPKRKANRSALSICRSVTSSHQKCAYKHIHATIIGDSVKSTPVSVLTQATPLTLVIRFVLTGCGKLFNPAVWGSTYNKSVILKATASYLKMSPNEALSIKLVVNQLRISEISWLGPSPRATSRQDSERRQKVLTLVVCWFFQDLITSLVRAFWYVTNSLQKTESGVHYIPHRIWRSTTVPWLEVYQRGYLKDCTKNCNNHAGKRLYKSYFHGSLRLIPKPHDFRLLCIPLRGDDSKYKRHLFDHIHPVRAILRAEMGRACPQFPCCNSTVEVIKRLQKFRASRLPHPTVSVVKFDMKHAYDSLSKRKVMELVERLVGLPVEKRDYMLREYSQTRTTVAPYASSVYRIYSSASRIVLGPLSEPSNGRPRFLTDRNQTKKFTNSQVVEVVRDQVYNSAVAMKAHQQETVHCFERQRGLFQGFPLLGILSEIAYNDLVETYFGFLNPERSLVLRLADDFLILTDDIADHQKVCAIIEKGFDSSHGAIINSEKTVIVTSSESASRIHFVGIELDPVSLEISRQMYSTISISQTNSRSFKALYAYLSDTYNKRVGSCCFDLDSELTAFVLNDVHELLMSVFDAVLASYKKLRRIDEFCSEDLTHFMYTILVDTLKKIATGDEIRRNITLVFQASVETLYKHPDLKNAVQPAIELFRNCHLRS